MAKPENDRRAFLKTLATAAIGGTTALLVATQAQAQSAKPRNPNRRQLKQKAK